MAPPIPSLGHRLRNALVARLGRIRAAYRPGLPRTRRERQRGVALIAVTVALAICMVVSNDFGTATTLETLAAANARDRVRAHFLARSSLEISRMMIRLQQRIEKVFPGVQVTDFADTMMAAFCGSGQEFKDFAGVDIADAKGLGIAAGGACGIKITTEDGKINVNCANNNAVAPFIQSRIDALYYFNTYDPVFEVEDAEGWRRDRTMQTQAILDYVDRDNAKYGAAGTPEDYGYENLKDSYLPKNHYLDSVGEMRLIRGIDDRFWTLFGDAFTVYGACKSNVNAMEDVGVIAATIYLAAKDKNDPALQDPQQLWLLASLVIKARSFFITFDKLKDFAEFVKDPLSQFVLPTLPGQPPTDNSSIMAAIGIAPGTKLGIELDEAELAKIADAGRRRTYRIEAWGEAVREQKDSDGNYLFPPVRRTITAVWDTKVDPQAYRPSATGSPLPLKGAWVFLREE
jgi:general secretion pathway protein K